MSASKGRLPPSLQAVMKPKYNFTLCEKLVRGGHIALAFSYTCALASLWLFEILLVKGDFGYNHITVDFLIGSGMFYAPALIYMLWWLPKCWRDAMGRVADDRIDAGLCPVCAYYLRHTPCAYEPLQTVEVE